jgi:hypothetical protein
VLRAVVSDTRFNKEAAIGTINSSRTMTSNTEKSAVLRAVARTALISDKDVRDAYLGAARTLTSDTEYRIVMEALPEL